ncbi:MAG: hydroxymethylglutaryl-CoA synthase [Candidatus Diapherotrites archaeon CG08_land_8_20_14_0_20_34_12]|nr:MAG: hydroxymethylglutaryl-CoA synthase [Candidatus Diapherotrites archaeon CG08_land_8_20_14_0_20_34_12]
MESGIVAYGVQIPKRRIKVEEIARVWEKNGKHISKAINVQEKAVAAFDEDSCTLAVEAARKAILDFNIDAKKLGAIYVGSESKPYAVKPTASIVAAALGANTRLMAADLEFACKAGTAGIQMCLGLVNSSMIEYGLSIGSDTAQGRPNDALEFTAGSGAGAIIVGNKKDEIIAQINHTVSFTTDTPDFWRRPHAEFPEHGGRFTGEPAYFKHIISAAKLLMQEAGTNADDYNYAVFHQPNGKFPLNAAKILGIDPKKVEQGLLTPYIGNTYSGATMIGLCSVLDKAEPGDRILAVSFGSGAGSDAFDITVTKNIIKRKAKKAVFDMIKEKEYVDYALYIKHRRKIKSL